MPANGACTRRVEVSASCGAFGAGCCLPTCASRPCGSEGRKRLGASVVRIRASVVRARVRLLATDGRQVSREPKKDGPETGRRGASGIWSVRGAGGLVSAGASLDRFVVAPLWEGGEEGHDHGRDRGEEGFRRCPRGGGSSASPSTVWNRGPSANRIQCSPHSAYHCTHKGIRRNTPYIINRLIKDQTPRCS